MTRASATATARDALRRDLRAQRAALSAGERVAAAQALVSQIERIAGFLTAPRIAGYWATDGELPLAALPGGVHARGQHWYLPVVRPHRQLWFAPWQVGAPLATNRFGIPEPVCAAGQMVPAPELDIVLVPLLGFDRHGHRLGFGGGYYDRSFAFLRERSRPARPLLIGVAHDFQQVDAFVPEAWDVPLDLVVTDARTLRCR